MGLINETNSEYYSGEQIILSDGVATVTTLSSNFDENLFDTGTNNPPTLSNYEIYTSLQTVAPFTWTLLPESDYSVSNNIITLNPGLVREHIKYN